MHDDRIEGTPKIRYVYAGRHARIQPREARAGENRSKLPNPGIYEILVPRVGIRLVTRPRNVHEQHE